MHKLRPHAFQSTECRTEYGVLNMTDTSSLIRLNYSIYNTLYIILDA